MKAPPRIVDPASIWYRCAGKVYRIGMRVETPGGRATVTWFDLDAFCPIVVTLDSDASEWRGDHVTIIPIEETP